MSRSDGYQTPILENVAPSRLVAGLDGAVAAAQCGALFCRSSVAYSSRDSQSSAPSFGGQCAGTGLTVIARVAASHRRHSTEDGGGSETTKVTIVGAVSLNDMAPYLEHVS